MNLTKRALLVSLTIRCWEPVRKDERASEVVHQHYHASRSSGVYRKYLIDVQDAAWKKVVHAHSALRQYHYAHTLPWAHKGTQIVSARHYLDYHAEINRLISAYLDVAAAFVGEFPRLKEEARARMNGLFREEDYPSERDLKHRFDAQVRYSPVPDSGHVIVDLAREEIERIRRDTDALVEEAVKEAQRDLWTRLLEPLRHMAETLADPERVFRDSLIGNVREIVALAPKLMLQEDEALMEVLKEAGNIANVSPNALRNHMNVRDDRAKKAAALVRKMEKMMRAS